MNDPFARRVMEAWTDPGPAPGYHRQWQELLRGNWPTLANALDALSGRLIAADANATIRVPGMNDALIQNIADRHPGNPDVQALAEALSAAESVAASIRENYAGGTRAPLVLMRADTREDAMDDAATLVQDAIEEVLRKRYRGHCRSEEEEA